MWGLPYKGYLFLIFYFTSVFYCTAQNNSRSFFYFSADKDLSSANIRKSIVDKNGFYWISTQDGLNKFDGKKFIQFTKDNLNKKRRLLGTDCYNITYDGRNFLYAISSYEGLNVIDINTDCIIQKIPTASITKSTSSWLKESCLFGSKLFIATQQGDVSIISTNNLKIVKKIVIPLEKGETIGSLVPYDNKIIAVISAQKTFLIDTTNFKIVSKEFRITSQPELVVDAKMVGAECWLLTRGLPVVQNYLTGDCKTLRERMRYLPKEYFKLAITDFKIEGENFYFSNAEGLFLFDTIKHTILQIGDVIDKEKIPYFKNVGHIGSENGRLIICSNVGIAFQKETPFTMVNKSSDGKSVIDHCYSFITHNNFLFISSPEGLYRRDSEGEIKEFLGKSLCVGMASISRNELLVSSESGLKIITNKTAINASVIYPELKEIENDLFTSIEQYKQNIFVLSSENQKGVFFWDKIKHTIKAITPTSRLKLPDFAINRIFIHDTTILIVAENAISKVSYPELAIKNVLIKENITPGNSGVFMDVCRTKKSYWFGIYGYGLLETNLNFKKTRSVTYEDGLSNSGIFKVFGIGDTLLMATTNKGITVLNLKTNKKSLFYQEDGLHSNSFEETSGYQIGDSLYIGGIKGFTIFDVTKYKINTTAPKLYFENITIQAGNHVADTTSLEIKHLNIPNNTIRTKVSFIGLNYQNPQRVRYWYKIDKIDKNWIALETQNFIELIGIPPGKYTLEVKAANEDGYESEPISMVLNFLPKWYQTLGFKVSLAVLIAALLWLLYRFRIRQLKKVFAVRQKISRDLHDDVSSTLSSINMYSEVAKMQQGNPQFLNNIQENAKDALEKLDDIVWANNPKNDFVKSVIERIRSFAQPLARANNISFNIIADGVQDDTKISSASRQSLFLICKEAVNNAVKYAACENIRINLKVKNNKVFCEIADDGKGFDMSQPTERNGLYNMQQRAESLKGRYTINTAPGNGTGIAVELPL